MTEMPAKVNRDVAWMTQTCSLGYDVMGKTSLSQLLQVTTGTDLYVVVSVVSSSVGQ